MTPRNLDAGRLDFVKEKPSPLKRVWNAIKGPLLLAGLTAGAVYAGGALSKHLRPGDVAGHPWSRSNFARTFYDRVNSGTATHVTGPMRQWAERNGILGTKPPVGTIPPAQPSNTVPGLSGPGGAEDNPTI
jgi:hypothetical protein